MDKNQLRQMYANIGTLLDEGIFPGSYSQFLTEARTFLSNVVAEITKEIPSEQQTDAQSSQADSGDSTGA